MILVLVKYLFQRQKTVDGSNSARVLIGCKHIKITRIQVQRVARNARKFAIAKCTATTDEDCDVGCEVDGCYFVLDGCYSSKFLQSSARRFLLKMLVSPTPSQEVRSSAHRTGLTIVNGLARRALLRTYCLGLIFREESGARYFEVI